MSCLENNGSGCIPVSFPFLRGHKEICSVSLTQLRHVFTSDYFSKIIHLSLSAASQTQMCIVRRRPELQMFTGETEASREVKELSTMRALRIYWPVHHGQKNGRLHERERASFMQ